MVSAAHHRRSRAGVGAWSAEGPVAYLKSGRLVEAAERLLATSTRSESLVALLSREVMESETPLIT